MCKTDAELRDARVLGAQLLQPALHIGGGLRSRRRPWLLGRQERVRGRGARRGAVRARRPPGARRSSRG
jgi:hypothetical protein